MTLKQRAAYMWGRIEKHQGALVSWYLMLSWLYYQHDISLVPDEDYDRLCKTLLREFDGIEHPHKNLVGHDDLSAGTGYALTQYPEITMNAASRLAIEDKHVKWNKRHQMYLKADHA